MSDLTIIGNTTPTIGVKEKYTFHFLNTFTSSSFINKTQILTGNNIPAWGIYILENNKWRLTKENYKEGNTVEYQFSEKSLSRKGIKIVVVKNGMYGELNIKPKRAGNPKIFKVELLKSSTHKPIVSTIDSYETVLAKAYCTDMYGQEVTFNLWEDDEIGAGHHPNNTFIEKKDAKVNKNGIAEASFNIGFMARILANSKLAKGDKDEGKYHEFYVTATRFGAKSPRSSKNLDLENPDYKQPKTPTSSTPK